jgi:hypothetical protein
VTAREVRDAIEEKYGWEHTLLDLQMLRLRALILRTVAMLKSWDGR